MQSQLISFKYQRPVPGARCSCCAEPLEPGCAPSYVYSDGFPGVFCGDCASDIRFGEIVDRARVESERVAA